MLNDAALMDAQQNLGFLQGQLTHIESTVYATQYPDITYPEFIPIDTSADEWAKTITFYSTDKVGRAKWGHATANDIPLVDINRTKYESEVHFATIGFDYTLEEIANARRVGINLSAEKGVAARRAYEELVEDVAFNGDAQVGFQGFLNNSGVTAATAANGASASPLWSSKTAAEILTDINTILVGIWSSSLTVEMADTLLLPLASYAHLVNTQMPNTSLTLLQWVMMNNIFKARTGRDLKIAAMRQLDTAGAGATKRMVAYRNAADVVKMHIPMGLRFLAPQQHIFRFVVPGMFRLGGVDIRRPAAFRYVDGI